MASWDYQNIGVSVTKDNRMYIEQVLECLGMNLIDINGVCYDEQVGPINKSFSPNVMGELKISFYDWMERSDYLNALYHFLNKVFGDTYVYYENEVGNNTSDYYYREEEIYDPVNKKIHFAVNEYCYGSDEPCRGLETYDEEIEIVDNFEKLFCDLLEGAMKKNYTELLSIMREKLPDFKIQKEI